MSLKYIIFLYLGEETAYISFFVVQIHKQVNELKRKTGAFYLKGSWWNHTVASDKAFNIVSYLWVYN